VVRDIRGELAKVTEWNAQYRALKQLKRRAPIHRADVTEWNAQYRALKLQQHGRKDHVK